MRFFLSVFAISYLYFFNFIKFNMFDGLIEGTLASLISDAVKEDDVTEIRLRAGRRIVVETLSNRFFLKTNGRDYILNQAEIDNVLAKASNYSWYAIGDEMKHGYVPFGKYRIGIAGEGVMENGAMLNVKNVSSLVLRVPHQVKNAADEIIKDVLSGPKSTLIIASPGAGKTTMLRELARLASVKYNVVIIDERYEISSFSAGKSGLDIGDADVVVGIPKAVAYENCVRALSPEIIVTDEIFRREEVDAVCDIARSGVKVFASLHGNDIDVVKRDENFKKLFEVFEFAVLLSKQKRAGTIVETRRING